jgi:hypothetical protein
MKILTSTIEVQGRRISYFITGVTEEIRWGSRDRVDSEG